MEQVRELTVGRCLVVLVWLGLALVPAAAAAQSMQEVLGPGDSVRVTVYPYPDLTSEVRLADDGNVNLPMIGRIKLKGMTPDEASREIAGRLVRGKFINNPQVDVAVLEARSRQVSVLGFVTRPGRYMLEGTTAKVSDVLAMAGCLVPEAADTAVVTRKGADKSESFNVDVAAVIRGAQPGNIEVKSGDSVFVPKAPVIYVYGEVIRGGSYRLEPGMTVMQAISVAGGITPRGSERRMSLRRRAADGKMVEQQAKPADLLGADDVIYVRESIF